MTNSNPQSTPPPEEVELDSLLWRLCYTFSPDTMQRPPKYTTLDIPQAKQALLRWREAYADKARIDELKKLIDAEGMMAPTLEITGMMIDPLLTARTDEEIQHAKNRNYAKSLHAIKTEEYANARISALRKQQGGLERQSDENK